MGVNMFSGFLSVVGLGSSSCSSSRFCSSSSFTSSNSFRRGPHHSFFNGGGGGRRSFGSFSTSRSGGFRPSTSDGIAPVHPTTGRNKGVRMYIMGPASMSSSHRVARALLTNHAMVLGLRNVSLRVTREVVSFVSKTTFTVDKGLRGVSDCVFLIAPAGISVSNSLRSLLDKSVRAPDIHKEC